MPNSETANPFETADGARNWIEVVEGTDVFREQEIYPRVKAWLNQAKLGETIADIGCGQGKCFDFVPNGVNYVGIEPSPPLVDRAVQLYGQNMDHKFSVGDAYYTGLKTNSADKVLSVHVLFHLDDLLRATREAARVLKPGGEMMVVTANPLGYAKWRSYYKDLTVETEKMFRGTLDFGGPHTIADSTFYRHDWSTFEDAFNLAGFSEPRRDNFPVHSLTSMALYSTLTAS